jgi:hypothetical protein
MTGCSPDWNLAQRSFLWVHKRNWIECNSRSPSCT